MNEFEVTTDQVWALIQEGKSLNLIDVREPVELAQMKIPGVKNIPLGELVARLGEFDKNEEYIIVCRSGNRSGMATNFLLAQGYKAKNMVGGMVDWRGAVE